MKNSKKCELLPCPFCGSTNIIINEGDYGLNYQDYYVCCDNCDCRTMEQRKKFAIEDWNTRHDGTYEEFRGEI